MLNWILGAAFGIQASNVAAGYVFPEWGGNHVVPIIGLWIITAVGSYSVARS